MEVLEILQGCGEPPVCGGADPSLVKRLVGKFQIAIDV